jgi:hypothetical protein
MIPAAFVCSSSRTLSGWYSHYPATSLRSIATLVVKVEATVR